MKVFVSNCLRFSEAPDCVVEQLSRASLYKNPEYAKAIAYSPHTNTNKPRLLSVSKKVKGGIVVPRGFDYQSCLCGFPEDEIEYIDNRHSVECEWPDPLYEPTLTQRASIVKIKRAKDDVTGAFLVVLPTARGKTFVGLSAAKVLNQRLLVIVDSDIIKRGWISDANKLFGIDKDDVGIIQQKTFNIGDNVTVATWQTLNRRKSSLKDIFSNFGMVVWDECHIIPANSINSIASYCSCKYMIGLTATETRKDGLEFVMYSFLGHPLVRHYIEKSSTGVTVPISDAHLLNTEFYTTYGGVGVEFDVNEFLEEQGSNEARNELICAKIIECLDEGRRPLVVTKRRFHVLRLYEKLLDMGVPIEKVDYIMGSGGCSGDDIDEVVRKHAIGNGGILLSTINYIQKGANIPPLDTLFVTSFINDPNLFTQVSGRIRRRFPGKKDPEIYIVFDRRIPRMVQIARNNYLPVFKEMGIERWSCSGF